MKRTDLVAFASGLLFAVGLGVSGMTEPAKVRAFLDVTKHWDPSLAFVMAGAIAVHFVFARRARRASAPKFADSYRLPTETRVDARLLVGAAIFGVGWGIAGYCPGPAIVSLVALSPATLAFVGAMALGMVLFSLIFDVSTRPESADHLAPGDASRDPRASLSLRVRDRQSP